MTGPELRLAALRTSLGLNARTEVALNGHAAIRIRRGNSSSGRVPNYKVGNDQRMQAARHLCGEVHEKIDYRALRDRALIHSNNNEAPLIRAKTLVIDAFALDPSGCSRN